MRNKFIIANWKMNKTILEAVEFVKELKKVLEQTNADVGIAPPFTALYEVSKIKNGIKLVAQNCFYLEKGAYTGEISPLMLKDAGVEYVIIGHSERRNYFMETDEVINKKIKAVFSADMIPVLCVGEKLEEREENKTFQVIENQIVKGLKDIPEEWVIKMVIAYEPVWAIGTGKNATPFQAQEVHSYIRGKIRRLYSPEVSERIRIIYGGSITPENFMDISKQPDVDGGLVGGASLDIEKFTKIIKYGG